MSADTKHMSTCATCNASLPTDATACPSCGAGVSEVTPFLAGSDDPWGARPPAPTAPLSSTAPPPLGGSGSPHSGSPKKSGFPTWAKVLIGVAALLIVLGSAGAFLAVRAFRSLESSALEFTQEGDVLATGDPALDSSLVGECIAGGSTVSCSTPHELEVFHIVPALGSEYPSFDELFDVSSGECTDVFESYVGIDYYESEFFLDAYPPSAESWDAGDHVIRCAAYDPFGDLTESIRGTAR